MRQRMAGGSERVWKGFSKEVTFKLRSWTLRHWMLKRKI